MRVACLLTGVLLSFGTTATAQNEPKREASEVVANSLGMKLAPIPAGEFLMGAPVSDKHAAEDEQPQHRVCITRPFHIGMFEVTQEEFKRVLGIEGSFFSPVGPGKGHVAGLDTARFPAEQVRWRDAVEFCRKLSDLPAERAAGRVYRLPTEAEWEYACRAGTTTAFALGDSLSATQANFNGKNPHGVAEKGPFLVRTSKVGSYAANAFGLYDMHGNVWEWCADWYGRTYYGEAPEKDPQGPKNGSVRVIRGGSWYSDGRDCRSAFRYADLPDGIFYVLGFRVVMEYAKDRAPVTATAEPLRTRKTPATAVSDASLLQGEDWPRWRGPRGDGAWHGPKIAAPWPAEGLKTLWRQPIGGGYSGVVVAERHVLTMDFTPAGASKEGSERVLCFDALTGKLLWEHGYPVTYKNLAYDNGPRASPTVADGRVYALGAVGDLHCLDLNSGRVLWSKDLVKDSGARVPRWGLAAAPLLCDELLIIHAGAEPNGSLIALQRDSGKEIWRSLPEEAGYSTPILVDSHGSRQVVCWTPANVRGVDALTGKLLWSIPFEVTYGTSIATPIFQKNITLVSGYYEGTKAILLEKEGARVLWDEPRNLRAVMSQPLYRAGLVYLLDRRHGLTCFELETGKKLWDDGNRSTPKGRNPQATLVWTGHDDQALILNSEGDLILARLNPTGYREEARANIIGPTWAHPAYAGSCVFARNDEELVCVLLGK